MTGLKSREVNPLPSPVYSSAFVCLKKPNGTYKRFMMNEKPTREKIMSYVHKFLNEGKVGYIDLNFDEEMLTFQIDEEGNKKYMYYPALSSDLDISSGYFQGIRDTIFTKVNVKKIYAKTSEYFDIQECSLHVKKILQSVPALGSHSREYIVKLLEDLIILLHDLFSSESAGNYAVAIVSFIKHRTGKSLMSSSTQLINKFISIFNVGMQNTEDYLEGACKIFKQWDKFSATEMYKKIHKFIIAAMCFSIFDNKILNFKTAGYSKMEESAIRRAHGKGFTLIYTLLDSLSFIALRGWQALKMGSLSPIYHDESSYSLWSDTSNRLFTEARLMDNPDLHGIDRYKFAKELDDCIDQGKSIVKYMSAKSVERKVAMSTVNRLILERGSLNANKQLSGMRKAPFISILVGTSSIGKSTVSSILAFHYAKIMKLETDQSYFYNVNAHSQFMDGAGAHQHTFIMDDIGALLPDATQGVDPMLAMLIQIGNNMGFSMPQAELEKKGKTPCLAQHVIATANNEHLHVHAIFACELAALRRFMYFIHVSVKPEFSKNGAFLDGSKVTHEADEYPNAWNFEIKKPVPAGSTPQLRNKAKMETVQKFSEIEDFLVWYSNEATEFMRLQGKLLDSIETFRNLKVCDLCHRPNKNCHCEGSMQADVETVIVDSDVATNAPLNNDVRSVLRPTQGDNRTFVDDLLLEEDETWLQMFRKIINDKFCEFIACFWYGIYKLTTFSSLFNWLVVFVMGQDFWFYRVLSLAKDYKIHSKVMAHAGKRIMFKLKQPPILKKIGLACAMVISLGVVFYSLNKLWNYKRIPRSKRDDEDTEEVKMNNQEVVKVFKEQYNSNEVEFMKAMIDDNLSAGEMQLALSAIRGSAPVVVEKEKENVWHCENFELSHFDVSPQSKSTTSLSPQEFARNISNNIVTMVMMFDDGPLKIRRKVRGLCLKGHVFIFNNHCIPEAKVIRCELVHSFIKQGITPNCKFVLNQESFIRYPNQDLTFVEILALPPKKDIVSYFCKNAGKQITNGCYAKRGENSLEFINLRRITTTDQYVEQLGAQCKLAVAYADPITQDGDCGSVLISKSYYGNEIYGLHMLGFKDSRIATVMLDRDDLEMKINKHFRFQVGAGAPMLQFGDIEYKLRDLDRKSPFRYIDEGVAEVYGSFEGYRPAPKSNVGETFICDAMIKRGYTITHGPPVMKGWEPWHIAAKEYLLPNDLFEPQLVKECMKAFYDHIVSNVSVSDLKEVHPFDLATTVNGVAGYKYVDKMNRNTSMGFPWCKSKRFYLEPSTPTDDAPDAMMFTQKVLDRVDAVVEGYLEGRRACIVFTNTPKDEPKSFKKIAAKETRIFMCGSTDLAIVCRAYFLPIVRLIQKNKLIFCNAIGTVCQSSEWSQLRDHIIKHGTENMVAGDFKYYDKKMSPLVLMASFELMIKIAELCGYDERSIKIMWGVAVDTCYPLGNFNGDLIQFYGGHASGETLTTPGNSNVNVLYNMYIFTKNTGKKPMEFFKYCSLLTYGDDNVLGVSSEISDLHNHTTMAKAYKDLGIVYTMAEKGAASIPLIGIDEVSFLKRTWRWDEDMETYFCPLEHESINKMVTMCVRTKAVTPEEQAASIISSALREYFFYGKKTFLEKRQMFIDVMKEKDMDIYMTGSVLPTYGDLAKSFKDSSA